MPSPLQVAADCVRVTNALREVLTALESHPVRRSCLVLAFEQLRRAFGDAPPPPGVTVDSTGLPDRYGLRELIRSSTHPTAEARDALQFAVDSLNGSLGISVVVFQDQVGAPDPTAEQLRAHAQRAREADDTGLREARTAVRHALALLGGTGSVTDTVSGAQVVAAPAERTPILALLRVYTNGVSDERLILAAAVISNDALSAHEKLTQIDELICLPSTASAEDLGQMLGVTRQAVTKTPWWELHRKGKQDDEAERRRAKHEERARGVRDDEPDDGDNR